jgi:hypothetical protein
VEGPACKIKETEGLFNSYASADRYATGLTRRPCGSGPSMPDPTAGDSRMRPRAAPAPETAALSPELAKSRLSATKLRADCTYTKLE